MISPVGEGGGVTGHTSLGGGGAKIAAWVPVKTVLTVWVRGKTHKTVDKRSRRIEEVKTENDARIVPPFSGALVASNEKNHSYGTIRVRLIKKISIGCKIFGRGINNLFPAVQAT
jgi:hypothetical protein